MTDQSEAIKQSAVIVEQISKILAGQDEIVQGLALCDLTATWLAGHHVVNRDGARDDAATQKFRRNLIQMQFDMIWQLVPENEREIERRTAHR